MKRTLSFLAIATLAAVVPASATMYSVNFTGTVYQVQGSTGQSVGSTVSGHFDLNGATGNFADFTIAGKSVATGYQSSAVIDPGGFDAIYTAQISPVSAGGTSNNSFILDLSSLGSWPSTDNAFTLLTDANQLSTNLDTVSNPLSSNPSTFNYYTANSNGTNIVSLAADLTSITVTATPEPTTVALFGCSLLGIGFFARRRRA